MRLNWCVLQLSHSLNPFTTAHFVVFQFGPILYGWGSNIILNKSYEVNLQDNIILFFVTDT